MRSADDRDDLLWGQEADLAEARHDGLDAVEGIGNEAWGRRCDGLFPPEEERDARSSGALHQADCTGELDAANINY